MKKEKPGYFFTYRHFRRDSGAATAACMVHTQDDGTFNLLVGFSFCNPKDIFSREEGRDHAADRLLKSPIFFKGVKGIAPVLMNYLKNIINLTLKDRLDFVKEMGIEKYGHSKKGGDFSSWFFDFLKSL